MTSANKPGEGLASYYGGFGYETRRIGFGKSPAVVVVDFQYGITERAGQVSPLITQAVLDTAVLCDRARSKGVPVIQVVTAFDRSLADFPPWKLPHMKTWLHGDRSVEVDSRVAGKGDILVYKKAPSAFHQTCMVSTLVNLGVDTVVVTGCVTSGCIRATILDSFSYGYRTIVPNECVGDYHKVPHDQNLDDVNRRYADVVSMQEVLASIEGLKAA